MKLKVLQFIPSISAKDGGTTTYMRELTPSLGELVELHVCALGKVEDFVPLQNATVHAIEVSLKHVCRMERQWMAVLDEVQPDIVHVNCCWMPQCALVQYWTRQWQLKIKNIKLEILLTPHGMLEPWIVNRNYWTKKLPAIWLYQRWAVKNVDVIVATAEEERQHIIELSWNKNVVMLPNGINAAAIEMKSEWHDAKSLLFMSRIHPKKGLEMLLEALADAEGLHLKIAGAGEPDYETSLKQKVHDLGLEQKVTFLGPVYDAEKWQLIKDADVVVLPSYSENFGLIVAEALASGTPVLTTKGTPWKDIEESRCGWWVEATAESIKKALLEAKQTNAEELKNMGQNGRHLIERKFDVLNLSKSLANIYANR